MQYISTAKWRDLTDGHLYHEGDSYPHDGRKIPAERINALISGQNRAGLRLITAIEAQDDKPQAQTPEAPETAKKTRKTATARKPRKAE